MIMNSCENKQGVTFGAGDSRKENSYDCLKTTALGLQCEDNRSSVCLASGDMDGTPTTPSRADSFRNY